MGLLQKYKSRRYFKHMLLTMISMLLVFEVSSSIVSFISAQSIVIQTTEQANQNILSQIDYNIHFVTDTVRRLSNTFFYDGDVAALMNELTDDMSEELPRISNIDKLVSTSSFLHSLVIYNGNLNKFFIGNSYVRSTDANLTSGIQAYVTSNAAALQLGRLIPLHLENNDKAKAAGSSQTKDSEQKIDLFSSFFYDSYSKYKPNESFVVLNIEPQWLFDNIKNMNRGSSTIPANILILDSKGQTINPQTSMIVVDKYLQQIVLQRAKQKPEGFFTYQDGHEKQILTYLQSDTNGWTIVYIQPYRKVFAKVQTMKIRSIEVTIAFILLALMIAYVVSRRLYGPIEGLVKQINGSFLPAAGTEPLDELAFLSSAYDTARKEIDSRQAMVRNYTLRRLITDSPVFTREEYVDSVRGNLRIDPNEHLLIGVIAIYPDLTALSFNEKRLYHFAISNIAEEILVKQYKCEIVDMRSGHFAFLVSVKEFSFGDEEMAIFRGIQETIRNYYKLQLTFSFGDIVSDHRLISQQYLSALHGVQYRIIFGNDALITQERIRSQLHEGLSMPSELEKQFVESIHSNDLLKFEGCLNQLKAFLIKCKPEVVTQYMLHLTMLLQKTVRDMNHRRVLPIGAEGDLVRSLLLKCGTLDEMLTELQQSFRRLLLEPNQSDSEKSQIIVETMKEWIEENYMDPNLSLQSVADTLKMSLAYVGRLFKKESMQSTADYINEVRLNHALALLENSEKSVIQIMEKVGFTNHSYFFTLFKKKFGTTPKEYRLKRSLE